MIHECLQLSPRIAVLPVINGSGDVAVEVRRQLLLHPCDCLAIPLPPSFQRDVEHGVRIFPAITAVLQEEPGEYSVESESARYEERDSEFDDEADADAHADKSFSYVPIDPCQPVIAAIRFAIQERIPRAFIDLETARFRSGIPVFPDPYALKKIPLEKFAAAVLPALQKPAPGQPLDRVQWMAQRLRKLEKKYRSIIFICSLSDWPWIKDAYFENVEREIEPDDVEDTALHEVRASTLMFFTGELPYITGRYEQAREDLDNDENLSIDGIKDLLLESRNRYETDLKHQALKITPLLLSQYLKYARNLSLVERRMTPDLYTLIVAAQQMVGDQFAIHLAQTAREYPYEFTLDLPKLEMGIGVGRLMPSGDVVKLYSRLPGPPVTWRKCELRPRPPKWQTERWQMKWNPYRQCSWPPEDSVIEKFRTHVKDHALQMLGADLARTEKFSTSFMDGLDIRETLRNWHTGDLYVKICPPTRGGLDCVIMLFDSPADPRDYPWRMTWQAEHHDESTLAFFATNFHSEMVGPGIGQACYGGSLFLFPPRDIPDIWHDPRLDFANTLEERLIAAASLHSGERHVALLSSGPPGLAWKRIAQKFRKKIIHVPMNRFSQQMIQQMRIFHVLNGREVRSYAANFIRRV
ncbi:MAG: hypothetical protein ACKVT0_07320 [Planctomycetaceae bacterium]